LRLTTQGEAGDVVPGTHAGAPHVSNLRRKMAIASVVAVVVWAIVAGIILSGAITVRDLDVFNRMTPLQAGETGG